MNFLGIGPGEIILILIVLLVVVGPDRLPEFSRQAGRLLVRTRNWLQHSPDAALVMRARQEIEQELATIRSSLLEVQNVRDEVIGAAKQLESSVQSIATTTRQELNDLIPSTTSSPQSIIRQAISPPKLDQLTVSSRLDQPPVAQNATVPAAEAETPEPPAAQHEPAPSAADSVPADTLTQSDIEELNLRLQAVMSDLWALQEQLRQRGVLSADWQPPSFSMNLPDEIPTPPNIQAEEVS